MDKSVKKYACLVADDEPQARSIIEAYIQELPYLECVGTCKNAFEVLTMLQNTPIDIVFLDIKMPALTGLELVKTLEKRPKIIFTTAYSEYAVDAFDLGVADYLMKPVSFERFLKAVNRCLAPSSTPSVSAPISKDFEPILTPALRKEDDFIFLKTDRTFIKVLLNDIHFVEAYGNYVKVHLTDKTYVVSDKISTIGEHLIADGTSLN
jgi:two-component system, LytTR family, response regulator